MMYSIYGDWTYDMFFEDAKRYNATPRRGVHCRSDASYREYFMTTMKGTVRDFCLDWGDCQYDSVLGWIGDAYARELSQWFSDFYKEAYGQRPHLPVWYYVHALGLPTREDVSRLFCANPIENAIRDAKLTREGR